MKTKGLPNDYRPSIEEIEHFLSAWEQTPRFSNPQKALDKLFQETYKKNDCLEEVLIKCSALNNLYSTSIFDIHSMAMHICGLKIDEKLRHADYSLLKEIASLEIKGKKRYFYSFASKYCSHHLPDTYAIYDNYVEKVLVSINLLNKENHFADFSKVGLRNYNIFMSVLQSFCIKFGLTNYSIIEIDHYLWQLGKKYYS